MVDMDTRRGVVIIGIVAWAGLALALALRNSLWSPTSRRNAALRLQLADSTHADSLLWVIGSGACKGERSVFAPVLSSAPARRVLFTHGDGLTNTAVDYVPAKLRARRPSGPFLVMCDSAETGKAWRQTVTCGYTALIGPAGPDVRVTLTPRYIRVWLVEPRTNSIVAETTLTESARCPGTIYPSRHLTLRDTIEGRVEADVLTQWLEGVLLRITR